MNRRLARSALLFVLLLVAAAARSRDASAQVTRADSAAVLLETAGRFQAEGQPDVAFALYRFVAEHFADTPAGARARSHLESARDEGTEGGGRVELEVWSTTYGLWLGVALPGAFGADSPEPYGAGLLLGGPVGFLTGKAIARSRPLSEGQARAITLGGTWGTWQGAGWANVLDLGKRTECFVPDEVVGEVCYETGDSSEETFAAMILGGVAGIAAGTVISRKPISPGVATTANFGALWGTWFGFAVGYLGGLEDDALLTATLVGGDAGLAAAAVGAARWHPSRSRARLVSIYGVIGGLSGLGIDLLLQPDDDKVAVGIPLAGSILGLAIGSGVTRSYDTGGGGAGGGNRGALLGYADGAWSMDPPVPYPVMLERDGPQGPVRAPGLGVTWLSARFF
jgi:hypothetical protein